MPALTYCMGLFPKIRNGELRGYKPNLLNEVEVSLALNPWYRERMTFLAGEEASDAVLRAHGLKVLRMFTDAPSHVWRDTTFRMKAWMIQWAAEAFGGVMWVDWDTLSRGTPDKAFEAYCRCTDTPRFVRIPGYQHARVNCSLVYAPQRLSAPLRSALEKNLTLWNDEHLWDSLLNDADLATDAFWFGERAIHVGKPAKAALVSTETQFVHLGANDPCLISAIQNRFVATNLELAQSRR